MPNAISRETKDKHLESSSENGRGGLTQYEDLRGKRLLILGATELECQIVDAAREMGIYTITTDSNENWDDAPAKKIADEAWNISWSDIPALKEMALNSRVDGVIAGYSEFRTNCAIKLSRELGTTFYITDEDQLAITRDKLLFKSICRQYGVPVAKDYYVTAEMKAEDLEKIVYPVIVKPTDNAGSRGIRFCNRREDIASCIEYALSYSESKRGVGEEVLHGHEVVAYYTLADGRAAFSSIFDKYARIEREGFNALMDAYLYPSNQLKKYLEKYDANVRRLLQGMGLKNGVISLQGFAQPDGSIVFFELGFRLGGTSAFHYTEHFNGVSHLRMLISHSLTGNMHPEELEKEDPTFKGHYGCTFTLLAKDGVIASMSGKEKVDSLPNVLYSTYFHRIGTEIVNNGSQFPKAFRAFIIGPDLDAIRDTIRFIQDTVSVKNTDGEDMLLDRFDVSKLSMDY